MTSLTVEAHKKRFSVKVTPMQPLLAVVAEALAQLKLGDVDPKTCQLLLNKKALDLGCPVRLANLPSGAKLELITGREPRLGVLDTDMPPAPAVAAPVALQAAQAAHPATPAAAVPSSSQPPAVQQQQQQPAAQPLPAAAAPQPQQPAPAAAPAAAGAPEAGAGAAAAAAAAAAGPQHPSVAVFGQEVHVFTREAELALESEHMALDQELPDEFYEMTEGDMQRAMAGLTRARVQAEGGDKMLMTKQMRAAEEAKRAAAYGAITVRASLPDGHVLQATFQAAHPLSKLRSVVRRAVAEGLADKLYLYTAPPKTVLKDLDASFYQAKLIPAARVHVGIQGQAEPVGGGGPLLRPEVLALVGPPPDKAAALHSGRAPQGATVGAGGDKRRNGGEGGAGLAGSGAGSRGSASAGAAGAAGGGSGTGTGKPKWLKL